MEPILLPQSIISRSPSNERGLSSVDELRHRVFGCQLIVEIVGRCGVTNQAIIVQTTAQHCFHRVFYSYALQELDTLLVVCGCVLLAMKIEEQPQPLKEV